MEKYSDIPVTELAPERDLEKETRLLQNTTPESIYLLVQYAIFTIGGRWPEAEPYIVQHVPEAYHYAKSVIKGRWPEAEPLIMKVPLQAYHYANEIIRGRWPEAEPYIAKDPLNAYKYARDVIKGRWPEAEPVIAESPEEALWYAQDVIKGRWPEAEKNMSLDDPDHGVWRQYKRFLDNLGMGMDIWKEETW